MNQAATRRITRLGAGALATGVVLVIAAFPLASYGLAVFGLALGLTVVLGAAAPRHQPVRVKQDVNRSDPMEGDEVRLKTTKQADGRARFVEWRLELPEMARADGPTAGFMRLDRNGESIPCNLRFPMFGLQRLGPLHVRIGDPFGFAAVEGNAGRPAEIRVYPRHDLDEDLAIRSRQLRSSLGMYEVSQPGDGFEFFNLRNYHVGDRPRDINWKASARYGQFIVNQRQRENHAVVTILLDVRSVTRIGARHMSPFAQGCRAAIALAAAHLRSRNDVRLVAYGESIVEDRHTGSARHLQGILDLIVGLEPGGEMKMATVVDDILPRIGRKSPVVLISPLVWDDTVRAAVTALRSRDTLVSAFVPTAPGAVHPGPDTQAWKKERAQAEALLRGLGVHIHAGLESLVEEERRLEMEAVM